MVGHGPFFSKQICIFMSTIDKIAPVYIALGKSSLPLKDGKNMEMPKCTNLANVPEKR